MKHSVKFSDAIHILVYIEMLQGTDLSSEVIAKSVNANPVSVRRIMSSLKKAGLIISQSGKANPALRTLRMYPKQGGQRWAFI